MLVKQVSSGGLTAHYKMGARTGGANLMIGGLILAVGLFLGSGAVSFLSIVPLSVLGVLLVIVGIYHTLLIRDLHAKRQLAVAGTVAITTTTLGNLASICGAGILLHHILRPGISRAWLRLSKGMKYHREVKEGLGQ